MSSKAEIQSSKDMTSEIKVILYPQYQLTLSTTSNNTVTTITKSKRKRTAFNNFQLIQLENEFMNDNYVDKIRRFNIAQKLSLSEKVIKIWFQNRRMKSKKEDQLSEAKSISKTSYPKTEQTAHKGTVQRLMAYSQFAATETIRQSSDTIPVEGTNTCAPDLNEILQLLEENSSQRGHSCSLSSEDGVNYYTCDIDLRSSQQGIEFPNQNWSTKNGTNNLNAVLQSQQLAQQTSNILSIASMPCMNLTWGEPLSKRQRQT